MTPKQALWMLIAGSALIRLICAFNLGLGNDEAYHFLYAAHPALSYYDHPPMMAWVEMAGLTLSATRASAWALADRLHRAFWGFDVAAGAGDDSILRPLGGLPGGLCPQCHGLLRARGRHVRVARRSLALLLAAHHRPAGGRARRARFQTADALGLGGPGMGRGHAEQVSRRVDPARNGPLCLAPPSDEALAVAAGTVPGVWPGAARVQSGPHLECRSWLGVVPVPGGPRGRELDAASRLPRWWQFWLRRRILFPWIWGSLDPHLDQRMPELADDRLGSRAALALPGGRSRWASSPRWRVFARSCRTGA